MIVLLSSQKFLEIQEDFFLETFQAERYTKSLKIDLPFVQDNHSRSSYGTLRGLHFQKNKPQGKLVRVSNGQVFDVVVDIRSNSSTFRMWEGFYLSGDNMKQLWVPPGFAHGFVVTSDIADFEYKCTEYYDPTDEECILWNDKDLSIKWPINDPQLSEKDLKGKNLGDLF